MDSGTVVAGSRVRAAPLAPSRPSDQLDIRVAMGICKFLFPASIGHHITVAYVIVEFVPAAVVNKGWRIYLALFLCKRTEFT